MRSFRLTSLVAGAALSVSVASFAGHAVLADSVESVPAETGNGDPVCRSDDIGIERKPSDMSEGVCPEQATETHETARARAYLIETATPGYTMTRQGPERAIGRLHPEFVRRLAAAIADARVAGLPFAGIFSAYRHLHSALAASPTNSIRSILMGSPSMLPGSAHLARLAPCCGTRSPLGTA